MMIKKPVVYPNIENSSNNGVSYPSVDVNVPLSKEELFVKGAFLKKFLNSDISDKMDKCDILHYRDFLARQVELDMPGVGEKIKSKITHFI